MGEVRTELHQILAEACEAQSMPWDASKAALNRTIFPQMTNCLPEKGYLAVQAAPQPRNASAACAVSVNSR
jgi:hypothetical protein